MRQPWRLVGIVGGCLVLGTIVSGEDLEVLPKKGDGYVVKEGEMIKLSPKAKGKALKFGKAWKEKWEKEGMLPKDFVITSGYRSKKQNKKVGSKYSAHLSGNAIDIQPIKKKATDGPITYKDKNYDPQATQKLVNTIKQVDPSATIIFGDKKIQGVISEKKKHKNHLHVTLGSSAKPPSSTVKPKYSKAKPKKAKKK